MNKTIKGALFCSAFVAGYGLLFHYLKVIPNDWVSVIMWLPFYISPIWAVAGYSLFTERGKNNGNLEKY